MHEVVLEGKNGEHYIMVEIDVFMDDAGIGYYEYGSIRAIDKRPFVNHEITRLYVSYNGRLREINDVPDSYRYMFEDKCIKLANEIYADTVYDDMLDKGEHKYECKKDSLYNL